jgi:DNA-binding transcriptional regulator YiaG
MSTWGRKVEAMGISAEEIKAGRERRHMTQQQLADEVGVSLRTVGSWERGESVPRNRLSAVAEALGLEGESQRDFGRDAMQKRIGQLAKQRREELGLGRVAFARSIGLGSDKTLQDFEFGRRLPFGTTVRKIEKALGWKLGVVDELLESKNRKASAIMQEELDEFEPGQPMPLDRVPTAELLAEVIRRLGALQSAIGAPQPRIEDIIGVSAPKDLFDLAASTNVEHLEDDEEADEDEQDD